MSYLAMLRVQIYNDIYSCEPQKIKLYIKSFEEDPSLFWLIK
jgi:hypothetical protein